MAKHTPPPGWINPLAPQQPLTSLGWIAGALTATLLFALLCVYITFCLLFWQGQWQLVFHPSHAVSITPAADGIAYDDIQFDATETGTLQLNGWWVPAERNAPFAGETLLLMHGASGSLSDTVPQIQILHHLGINVFAFDYRGFGRSLDLHPSEKTTYDDAEAAYRYLVDTRHLPPASLALDGTGLGAAIAAETARRQPQAAALILENPAPPVLNTLHLDRRTRLLPMRLLFHDRFDARDTLAHLHTPTLLLRTTIADPYSLGRLQTFLSQYLSLLSLPTIPTPIPIGVPLCSVGSIAFSLSAPW